MVILAGSESVQAVYCLFIVIGHLRGDGWDHTNQFNPLNRMQVIGEYLAGH